MPIAGIAEVNTVIPAIGLDVSKEDTGSGREPGDRFERSPESCGANFTNRSKASLELEALQR
jgi:hypothetical protein